jgi:hypothetical protein
MDRMNPNSASTNNMDRINPNSASKNNMDRMNPNSASTNNMDRMNPNCHQKQYRTYHPKQSAQKHKQYLC